MNLAQMVIGKGEEFFYDFELSSEVIRGHHQYYFALKELRGVFHLKGIELRHRFCIDKSISKVGYEAF